MPIAKSIILLIAMSVALTGCQSIKSVWAKRDNGSLDYQSSHKHPPIQLPINQTAAPFTPIYEVPRVSGQPTQTGKQYQLPSPPKVH